MATFRMSVELEGDAFGSDDPIPELRRIIKRLVVGDSLREDWENRHKYGAGIALRDHNGNRVGTCTFNDEGDA